MGYVWIGDDGVPYRHWQINLFVRSGVIIAALIACDLALWICPGMLAFLFRSLKVKPQTITSHGIVINSDEQPFLRRTAYMVYSSYAWVLRGILLTFCLQIWNNLIVRVDKYDLDTATKWNVAYSSCQLGSQCYALSQNSQSQLDGLLTSDFVRVLLVWDLEPVCDQLSKGGEEEMKSWINRDTRQRKVACYKRMLWTMRWSESLNNIAAAIVIGVVGILLFEGLTAALLQYTHRKFFNLRVLLSGVIVLLSVSWIYCNVMEGLYGVGDTAHYFVLLSWALVCFHALRVAKVLSLNRRYQDEMNLERLRKTELGAQLDEMLTEGSSEKTSRSTKKRDRAQQLFTKIKQKLQDKATAKSPHSNTLTNETFD